MTSPLYVPPHRRAQSVSFQATHSLSTESSNSAHANLRMQQREISQRSVDILIKKGHCEVNPSAATYRDKATFAVVSGSNKVITVLENRRNTNFDLNRQTRDREAKLLQQVEKNNDVAMCELGELYLNGAFGEPNVAEAMRLFMQAANRRNSHAMCLLANIYDSNLLGPKDPSKAFDWLLKAANLGNKFATAIIGQHYMREYEDSPPDTDPQEKLNIAHTAMRYLERSAAKGSTRAMWSIAKIYERGWLGEKNLDRAIAMLVKAAERGSPASLFDLNEFVKTGEFPAEQLEEILNTISPIVAETSSQTAWELGLEQIEGRLGSSPQRGMAMLEVAAKHRNVDAAETLAIIYRDGRGEIKADPSLSLFWFNQLKALYQSPASKGNIDAMWQLGELFLSGNLGQVDLLAAERLFLRAANSRSADCLYSLGMYYSTGKFGDADPIKGNEFIEKAIAIWVQKVDLKDSMAARYIAEIYFDGDLGSPDYSKAIKWYITAFELGDMKAGQRLAQLYMSKKTDESLPEAQELLATVRKWMAQLENKVESITNIESTPAKPVLILGKLYQEKELLLRNLEKAARSLCLALHCSESELEFRAAYEELETLLTSTQWEDCEKNQLMIGLHSLVPSDGTEATLMNRSLVRLVSRILGDVYNAGILTERNLNEAVLWYEVAAKYDNSKAMCSLGQIYLQDLMDITTAVKWFVASIKQSDNEKARIYLTEIFTRTDLDPVLKAEIETLL